MAGTYNISFKAGDTYELPIVLFYPDTPNPVEGEPDIPGEPMDLTGYTVKSQIRLTADDPAVLAEFNVIGTLGPSGAFKIRLEAAETEVFRTTPLAVWDLETTKISDNTRLTVLEGQVRTTKDVTRD